MSLFNSTFSSRGSVVPATFSIGAMVASTIGKEAKKSVMNSLDITLFLLRVVRNGTS